LGQIAGAFQNLSNHFKIANRCDMQAIMSTGNIGFPWRLPERRGLATPAQRRERRIIGKA